MGRPKNIEEKRKLTTTITVETHELLRKISYESGRSINWLIENAVKELYGKNQKPNNSDTPKPKQ